MTITYEKAGVIEHFLKEARLFDLLGNIAGSIETNDLEQLISIFLPKIILSMEANQGVIAIKTSKKTVGYQFSTSNNIMGKLTSPAVKRCIEANRVNSDGLHCHPVQVFVIDGTGSPVAVMSFWFETPELNEGTRCFRTILAKLLELACLKQK